jgi:hypothetical protein
MEFPNPLPKTHPQDGGVLVHNTVRPARRQTGGHVFPTGCRLSVKLSTSILRRPADERKNHGAQQVVDVLPADESCCRVFIASRRHVGPEQDIPDWEVHGEITIQVLWQWRVMPSMPLRSGNYWCYWTEP